MSDPLIHPSTTDIIEKVGLTIAAIIGLVYVLKWLSQTHLKALNDRITTLEVIIKERDGIIAARDRRIEELHAQHLDATIRYGHDMKAVAMMLMDNDKANRSVMRSILEAMDRHPCLHGLAPATNPGDETDRMQAHG